MANELIVCNSDGGQRIAILENKRLVELHFEKSNKLYSVGDLYLGRVKKLMPGLNAAFVDVGYGKDAFLHYLDLGPQVKSLNKYIKAVNASAANIDSLDKFTRLPDIDKHGKISDVLKPQQPILVQIVKEAISTKGPRLSCEVSLAGNYVILVPFSDDVSISRKINSAEEKKRLRKLVDGIRPANFGVILRTAAEGCSLEELQSDIGGLLKKWEDMSYSLVGVEPPVKVLSEIDRTATIVRDMLSVGFESIYTDDQTIFNDLQEYLKKEHPDQAKILRFHKSKISLFEAFGIEKQIKASFGKTVNVTGGSYLIIEHTEALHVIDVNSGSTRLVEDSPEGNALKINMEAATEISRQLRLRDMGGIIVVDFIDLRKPDNKRLVYEHLVKEMEKDRAKHTVLPMSKFGLIQITRQRVRPEMNIVTTEMCPSCNGTGKIMPSILIVDEIENNIDYLIRKIKASSISLYVHPFIEAFLKSGWPSHRMKWFFKYKKWIPVKTDSSLPLTSVKYYNASGEELKFE